MVVGWKNAIEQIFFKLFENFSVLSLGIIVSFE